MENQHLYYVCCCLFSLLFCLQAAVSSQTVPEEKMDSFSIDLTHFGTRPQSPSNLFFQSHDQRSKNILATASRGDKSIKGDNMATRSREVPSDLAMKLLNLNSGRGRKGNGAVMTAEGSHQNLFPLKPAETRIDELPTKKRARPVFPSLAAMKEKDFIDRKQPAKGRRRDGGERGERGERGDAQTQLWLSPVKRDRSSNPLFTSRQTNSTLRPRRYREDPNTEKKSTPFRRVGLLPFSPFDRSLIFPHLKPWRRSNALSDVQRSSENGGQNLAGKRNKKLTEMAGESEFRVVFESDLRKSANSRHSGSKSDSSTTLIPPLNIHRSESLSDFHSNIKHGWESEQPSPPFRKSAKSQVSRKILSGESITNSVGVPEVPQVVSKRNLPLEGGQRKVKVVYQFTPSQIKTPTPLLATPRKNVTLAETVDLFDWKGEEGGRGRGKRGRVRRDVGNQSDAEESAANVTSGSDVNSNNTNDGNFSSSTETVGMTSSLSSVTNAVSQSSSSQTVTTTSDVSSSQDSMTSAVNSVKSTLVLTTTTTTMTTTTQETHQSSSSPSSTMTSQETTKAAEMSSSSSTKSSSDDVSSSTNLSRSTSSSTPVVNTSQAVEKSFADSSSSVRITTKTTTQTLSDFTEPTKTDATAVTNETLPVTTAHSKTPLFSKLGSSSTMDGENEVTHTATSHKRTPRSTQSSSQSSSASSPAVNGQSTSPAFSSTQDVDPGSTDESLSAGPLQNVTSSGLTSAAENSSTPRTDAPSSSLTPQDVFGDLWTSDPEPHPEGEPYPEPGKGGQGGGGGKAGKEEEEEPASEPGPDWINAKMVWQGAWEVHLYVFACLFAGLGLYTLICVLRLWRIHRLLSRRYFVSLNLLMLLLALSRAVYLSVDGYNSKGTFHPSVDYFFYSISFPCLTSSFSIQLYALLQATKMQFLPPTIQKMSLLVTMIVFHFAISVVTDVIVGMYAGMEIMLFVCQLFFILWGLFLFFGYAYIFRRLYLHAVKRQKNVMVQQQHQHQQQQQQQQSNGSGGGGGGSLVKPKSKFTLSVAVKVTFSTAILGLVTVGLEIYGVVGVYKNFSSERPQPWPWYVYHTALRLVEFLMCATMSYVASQPFRYRKGRQTCCCPVLCAPCAEIFCCGADVNRSDLQAAWSELDHHHQLRASVDRGPVHHQVTLDPDQDQSCSNGLAQRGSSGSRKGPPRGGRGSADLTVTAKARIYFSDQDDVRPIVTSQPGSRPTSETSETLESRTVSGEGCGGVATTTPQKKPQSLPLPTTTTMPANGVVNTAFMPATEEPQPQTPAEFKSRKSSIASSEYYLAPSVSLADSMASELDKAFRSMRDEDPRQVSLSSVSGQSRDMLDLSPQAGQASPFPRDNALQNFLHLHPEEAASNLNHLRRSHSAFGRSSFYDSDHQKEEGVGGRGEGGGGERGGGMGEPGFAWHQKLFRSRSDNLGGIRTKDVAKATYMSLLDIEQRQSQQESASLPKPAEDSASDGCKADPPPPAIQPCSNHGATENAGGKDTAERNSQGLCGQAFSVSDSAGNSENLNTPRHTSPPSPHDVNGVMTSTQGPPYRTVISVGGGGGSRESMGDAGSEPGSPSLSIPPSYSPSPFCPPPLSGSPSLFRSGLTSSPHGLMGYGNPLDDEEDNIEV